MILYVFDIDGTLTDSVLLHKECYFHAHSYFNVEVFEQNFSIGDGYWDLVTAQNLKLEFIGINRGQAAEQLKSAGATNVFPDFQTM